MSNADVYQPCPCGSGKKLKFCCFRKAKELDGLSDRDLVKRSTELQVYECLANSDWRESGLAQIVVVRQTPNLKYMMGVYLVDTLCLGLKDTFVRLRLKYSDVQEFLSRYPYPLEEIPYEDARGIIFGGIEYAEKFGFEPNEDWAWSRHLIESGRDFERKFSFGREGKPVYVQGPHDDVARILKTLRPLLETGEASFVSESELFKEDKDGGDGDFDRRYEEVRELLEVESFVEAQRQIEDLMAEYPEEADSHFLMGTCLSMSGETEEAIPHFKRAIEIQHSPDVYYNLGLAYLRLQQFDEFGSCMRKAIVLDGINGDIGKNAAKDLKSISEFIKKSSGLTLEQYGENKRRFETAFAYLTEGRLDEAIKGFNKVLKVEPRHVQSFGNLGLAYAGLGECERAIQFFDRAIELDPEYQPAIDNREHVMNLLPGEALNLDSMREIEFYKGKAREDRSQVLEE